jgi:hypothetical protein
VVVVVHVGDRDDDGGMETGEKERDTTATGSRL